MATAIQPDPVVDDTGYYNVKEAARRIRVGERAIRDGINHEGWPHSRIGRRIVISEADLAEIYRLHRAPVAVPRGRRRAA
ncbi:helix-turn-helix domain-containing protein [Kitasatospora cathayae]|uniref:Helix-turn-helix domain-containing protein n=1 Tax=Kitasatospora cathayae TaxID=3004092 RepID=A0ABY7Q9X5_9ACTN|nr:helix-turn-helix domain-containing protein [Kitasatospora sp. HUAS 3-15]WBP89472.1 helix-turn-helix domain-containing protein [Kitasatospora sp. HUAS 3-15]